MGQQYEIEIKSLLGKKENADMLRQKMCSLDPSITCISKNSQLNHYFVNGNLKRLADALEEIFSKEVRERLLSIADRAHDVSVRTRQKNTSVFLVVKASVDDTTSANGISRMEFEEPVPLSLDELDALVLQAGFTYQAKWSREREEYAFRGVNVCLDKNAGYGYLAEFEKVVSDETALNSARDEVVAVMAELGAEELPQDRLERMFAHYNEHWPSYYGTDNVFTIE